MAYNVVTSTRPQVVVDEAALANLQQELARRGIDLERLRGVLETLSAVNEPERFMASAMAVCNQLAARWNADRVALGFLKGRYVRVRALSHTEKITRQMQLVQDIESAMEECLDQDVEVVLPPAENASYVARATEKLATRHGPSAVLSLPLRRDGAPVAVLTLERKADVPFKLEDIETLRLAADLVTARLVDLYEHDLWLGAKLAKATRKGLAVVLGPKHTWLKLAAVGILAAAAFCLFVDGTYRVDANFTLEVVSKQTITAPFDGILEQVYVEPGDTVATDRTARTLHAGNAVGGPLLRPLGNLVPHTMLAAMNIDEFRNKRAAAAAEQLAYEKQADIAMKEQKTAERDVALAQAAKAKAQVDLLNWQISQATITSPLDGVVLTGDLKQKLGARVKYGDPLFEVGQVGQLRAELSVPEDEIAEVRRGARGELATTSYPDQKIGFTVERINPVAAVVNGKNVFKVRVKLDELRPWMRPGMEGVAKVEVNQQRWGWLLTHRAIKWVRMKLWW